MTENQTRFNIQVSEKDIAKAKVNDSYKCVVSQAIARAIPDAHHIETDIQCVRFTRHGHRLVFLTPYSVAGYVVAFDAGDEIKPFSFQLRDPIKAKRSVLTEKGKAAYRARNRAYRAVDPSYGQRKTSKARKRRTMAIDPEEARASARAAYQEASEKFEGPASETTTGERPVPPTVFKNRQRTYGHRVLRINQQKDKADSFAV